MWQQVHKHIAHRRKKTTNLCWFNVLVLAAALFFCCSPHNSISYRINELNVSKHGKSPSLAWWKHFGSVIWYKEEDSTIASELGSKGKVRGAMNGSDMEYHEVAEQLIELQIMEKANCVAYALAYGYGYVGDGKEMGGKTRVAFSSSFM